MLFPHSLGLRPSSWTLSIPRIIYRRGDTSAATSEQDAGREKKNKKRKALQQAVLFSVNDFQGEICTGSYENRILSNL